MKRILSSGLLLVLLSACGQPEPKAVDQLPWQIKQTEQGYSEVFHLALGQVTLRDVIEKWHHFPEVAVIRDADGRYSLEAYFGKRRLGVFEARIVTELKADPATIEAFIERRSDENPQQSGAWRLAVSEADQALANDFLVDYLIYMPVIDYEADIIRTRFGEPSEIRTINDQAAYWFYPKQFLAILLNADGGEIFYYSAPAEYEALYQRLLSTKPKAES